MKKMLYLIILLALSLSSVWAQSIAEYTFSTSSSGSLQDMSTNTTTLLSGYYDDTPSAVTDIGFSFKLGSTFYSQFSANSNGQMQLGSTAISGTSASPAAGLARLAPISGDNVLQATGKVHYKLVGSSPNSILIVEWNNLYIPYASNPTTGTFSNAQVWLYESSNRIDYVYGIMYNNSTSTVSRGVFLSSSNVAGSVGNITTIITTPLWVTTGTSVTNTTFPASSSMVNLNGTSDGSRRVFTFTPPSPLTRPNAAVLVYPLHNSYMLSGSSLSWNPGSTAGGAYVDSYNVYFGITSTPPLIQNQVFNTYTPALVGGTTYYWKIEPVNSFGAALDCPVWSFTTPTATQLAESFEDTAFPPLGWANISTTLWSRNTTYKYHGTASASRAGTSTASTYYTLSTPKVTINSTSTLDFWAAGSSTTTAKLQVCYSTDRVNWTQVGAEIIPSATYTFTHYTYPLSGITPGAYYLGFRTGTGSGTSYVDHVIGPELYAEAPGAPGLSAPADLAENINEKPTLTWTAPTTGGIPTGYRLFLGTANPPTSQVVEQAGLTYTYTTPLAYNTNYYWTVEAYNGAGPSPRATVRSFTTRPDPTMPLPYVQDFNSGTSLPAINWVGSSMFISATHGADGTNGMYANQDSSPATANAVTNPIGPLAAVSEIRFDYRIVNYTSYPSTATVLGASDLIEIQISTDAGGSFNTIHTINSLNHVTSTSFATVVIPLLSYDAQIVQFKFLYTWASGDYYVDVDNVVVRVPPAGAPGHVNLINPANGSTTVDPANAVLTWSASMEGTTPDHYEVYVSERAIDPTDLAAVDFTFVTSTPNLDLSAQAGVDLGYESTWYWAVLPFNAEGISPDPEQAAFMRWSFTTLPDPRITTLPRVENFDAVIAPALPWGWSKQVTSSSSSYDVVTYTSTTPYSNPNHVRMYNNTAADELILVSPEFVPEISTMRVKFWAKSGSTACPIIVGTMSGPGGGAIFTPFTTITLTSTYTRYSVDFSTYTNENSYIAFKHGTGGTSRYIYIDNVSFEVPAEVAPLPTSLVSPYDGASSFPNPLLKWTPSDLGEPATTYKVYMNTTGIFTEADLKQDNLTTQYQSSGTVAGTTYYWKVVPVNNYGSPTVPIWSFKTPGQYQLAESFESGTIPPTGWSHPNTSYTWSTGSSYVYHGVKSTYRSTTTDHAILATPALDVSQTSNIEFMSYVNTNATQKIQLYYLNGETWTIIGPEFSLTPGVWEYHNVPLSSIAPPTGSSSYKIGFAAYYLTGGTSALTYIDHVIGPDITPILPGAPSPTAPADTAVNQSQYPTFTWTAPTTGSGVDYYNVFCDQDADPNTLIGTSTSTSYTAVDPLDWEATYNWKVVAHNRAGDGPASTIRSFTVMPDPTITYADLPYSQNFDASSAWPLGWAKLGTTGTASISTTSPNSPSYNLYMNSSSASSVVTVSMPPVSMSNIGLRLRFYAKSASTSPVLQIGYLTTPGDATSFVPFGQITPTSTYAPYILPLGNVNGLYYPAFRVPYNANSVSVYVDDLFLEEVLANDLAATPITGPSVGYINTPVTHNVNVMNMGSATQNSYDVNLKRYGDDMLAGTLHVTTPLVGGATASHAITWTPTSLWTGSLYAEVVLTGDSNPSNNLSTNLTFGVYPEGIWVEDFESGTIPAGWTIINNDGDTKLWHVGTYPHTGTYAAQCRYGDSSSVDNDDWLITPPLQVTSAVTGDQISFWIGKSSSNSSYTENWEVLVSTTNTNISSFTMIDSGTITEVGYMQKTYNLDAYGDSVIYIALRYRGTWDWYIYADDFVGPQLYSPSKPVVTMSTVGNNVVLNWNPVIGANEYHVYTSDDPYTWTSSYITVPAPTTTYSFDAAAVAKKFFKVVATSNLRQSAPAILPLSKEEQLRLDMEAARRDNKEF